MKIVLPALLLLFAFLVPLSAQVTGGDGSSGSAAPAAPAPPRNIMPLAMNHKPNPTTPPAEIAGQIDKFFKTLKSAQDATTKASPDANAYASAYDTFLMGTALGAQKEKKSVFIAKTGEAFGIYGPLNDYEIFDNYSVGSNVLVLTYLTRHQLQPLRWRFIYYRPAKSWGLINMGFDDVLLDMLD